MTQQVISYAKKQLSIKKQSQDFTRESDQNSAKLPLNLNVCLAKQGLDEFMKVAPDI